ncbi:MAG: bifunctional [glutamine synthetase] adenylyltransferase/[glutamine synthetase]-adenylyl-L-tyrosine phosphorylase, partial [Rhizobiales bacterium]|nr:bifunctional [glutamine synthetase] adenylyltransferase/[glutamine synthetase]-adenylyl-L-tyrosine phosphorylase [Hyphomicrobiales bacterium]
MNASATDADLSSLAAQVVAGPVVFAPPEAAQRLADWLADVPPEQAATIAATIKQFPRIRTLLEGIAEASPYLFDLIRADAGRLVRLLQSGPEAHFATLIAKAVADVPTAADQAEAMHLLRRLKAEAALMIALCDIGGVWPVMRVTQALTDLAVTSVQCALRFLLLQEAARGKLSPPVPERPEEGSGLVVLAMGKMG